MVLKADEDDDDDEAATAAAAAAATDDGSSINEFVKLGNALPLLTAAILKLLFV